MPVPRTPLLTVDGVVLVRDPHRPDAPPQVLLIKRGNEPFRGRWALPGGFVDVGEDPDGAVGREVAEETGLGGLDFEQFRVYGAPDRDPRGHTVSVVYVAEIEGIPPEVTGGDDATEAAWFVVGKTPELAFDHGGILGDVVGG
ncbi:NUDIX hydrolase [bacterium]|nr:NUDIX hydrolase [bacterium]MBU1072926.1 NUDIX hydrolase [bacterium]MBU1674798.1 NUDIX hydrolase [bacterium]